MFAGTGAVGWWVAKNYPNTTVVLNETCDELINMYRMMQKNTFSSFEQEYQKHVTAYASFIKYTAKIADTNVIKTINVAIFFFIKKSFIKITKFLLHPLMF